MAGTQLQVLRRRVVRGLGLFKAGTATGGAVGYLVDSGLLAIYDNDFFIGGGIVIIAAGGAAPEGEKRIIQSGDQDNSKVNVTIDFTVAPESGDTYEIYKGLEIEDVEDAVNEAIRAAAAGFWEPVIDETQTWASGTLVIDLSGLGTAIDSLYDIDYVGIQLLSSPATYPYSDVTDQVVFFWDGTTPKIQFFQEFPNAAKVKIAYRTRPTVMTTPTGVTGITYPHLDVYLRAAAVEQLMAAGFFGGQSSDVEWRKERWGVQKAEAIFDKYRMPEPPGRVLTVAPHIPVDLDGLSVQVGE